MKRLIVVVICMLAGAFSWAAEKPSLDSCRKIFDEQAGKIESQYETSIQDLNTSYERALKRLAENLQGSGELDGLLETLIEQKEFNQLGKLPPAEGRSFPEGVANLRTKYTASRNEIESVKSTQLGKLASNYSAALDNLTRKLTKDGHLVDAMEAKKERDNILSMVTSGADAEKVLPRRVGPALSSPLSSNLQAGLLLHHDFNILRKDQFLDKSESGAHGTLHGGEWVAGGRGSGNGVVKLADEEHRVDLGDVFNKLDAPCTIASWIYVNEFPKAWTGGKIFRTDANNTITTGISLGVNPKMTFDLNFGDGLGGGYASRKSYVTEKTIPKGEWMHLAVVVQNIEDVPTFYLDGELLSAKFMSGVGDLGKQLSHDDHPFVIAGAKNGFSYLLDDVMIWSRGLTDQEVGQVHQATR